MESLAGKAVIITGGNSGIGESIALKMASLGAKVCIAGRNEENLERVAKKCRENSTDKTEIITVRGDIRDEAHRQELIDTTVQQFGKIDVLVNNAGLAYINPVAETSMEEYDTTFDTNLKACVFLTQLAIPHLKKTKGTIINNSSFLAKRPLCGSGVYCMTKVALDMFTVCLANDLGPHGIRVNSINPGFIKTPLYYKTFGLTDEELKMNVFDPQLSVTPLRRIGSPDDCAGAVAFLASDAASFMTGQHMVVDGGRTIQGLDLN